MESEATARSRPLTVETPQAMMRVEVERRCPELAAEARRRGNDYLRV